jgi:hypothetical protein
MDWFSLVGMAMFLGGLEYFLADKSSKGLGWVKLLEKKIMPPTTQIMKAIRTPVSASQYIIPGIIIATVIYSGPNIDRANYSLIKSMDWFSLNF